MEHCSACNDTGKYKKPNDEDAFNKAYDRYDDMGIFNLNETYNKAIEEVGYTIITPCPYCHRK